MQPQLLLTLRLHITHDSFADGPGLAESEVYHFDDESAEAQECKHERGAFRQSTRCCAADTCVKDGIHTWGDRRGSPVPAARAAVPIAAARSAADCIAPASAAAATGFAFLGFGFLASASESANMSSSPSLSANMSCSAASTAGLLANRLAALAKSSCSAQQEGMSHKLCQG